MHGGAGLGSGRGGAAPLLGISLRFNCTPAMKQQLHSSLHAAPTGAARPPPLLLPALRAQITQQTRRGMAFARAVFAATAAAGSPPNLLAMRAAPNVEARAGWAGLGGASD